MIGLLAALACATLEEAAEDGSSPPAGPLPRDDAQPAGPVPKPLREPPGLGGGGPWRITLPEDADAVHSAPGWTGTVLATLGDVDGDGAEEIASTGRLASTSPDVGLAVDVLGMHGSAPPSVVAETSWLGGESIGGGTASGDLDGNGVLEVFVSGVLRFDVTTPSGPLWPVEIFAGHVPAIGDHDGDGLLDLVSVEPRLSASPDEAMVLAWFGPLDGVREPDVQLALPTGVGEGGVADLDGDGRDENLVGSSVAWTSAFEEGLVYVVARDDYATGVPRAVLRGGFEGANAGSGGLATPGDADGDGYEDLVVGRYSGRCGITETAPLDPTAAWLVNGPIQADVDLTNASARWVYGGRDGDAEAGCAGRPSSPGDVDGDGKGDVTLWLEERGLRVYTSSPSGVVDVEAAADGIVVASERHSCCEIVAADVDGDGDGDLVVSEPGDYNVDGHVYFILAPW